MPLDASTLVKADQIAHRFFAKFALVVDNARNVAVEPREDAKTDKWFNLETPDTDSYKDQLRLYRSISQLGASPPPLELQILMSVPELTDKQVLVHHPPSSSRARIDPTPTHILLESWTLAFISSGSASSQSSASSSNSSGGGAGEVTLATVYKHAMSVFRSLYTLLRVLPAWRICKRLRRRPGAGSRNGHLGVVLRVRARGDSGSENTRILGFDTPLSPSSPALPTATHAFEPVTHPMGVFALAVTYLAAPHFELDTVEALLSSRFLSLDAGPDFTPTLARNAQRESVSGSPGSLPVRTSLPRSPPQSVPGNRGHGHGATGLDPGAGLGLNLGAGTPAVTSVADRFILPVGGSHTSSGSRASLPSTSPRARTTALPGPMQVQRSTSAQQPPAAGSGSAGSIGSSSRLSREEGREGVSSIASRVRRESLGMGRGSDLPSAPGPLLIRRQSATVRPSVYSNSPGGVDKFDGYAIHGATGPVP
ncbi:autophagy-related protein 13-domain-containing protein [Phellopilus nigrolimitatus]|nr:autophagy-related protein 13-domain-containing protein [Phellopilus nigrolimitatus]